MVNKIFHVTVLLLIYFYNQFVPALMKALKQLMDLVLSQEDELQTYRTVREISREMGIHRSSLCRIICNVVHLKCFKRERRRAQELADANSAARMKRPKLLLKTSCSLPLTLCHALYSLRTKRCSRSLHLIIGRTTGALKMQFVCIFSHIC